MGGYQNFNQRDERTIIEQRQRREQLLWSHIARYRFRYRLIRQGKFLFLLIVSAICLLGLWMYIV